MGVREVLADELKFLFVQQRRLHDDGELPVDERRDLDVDELDGEGGGGFDAGRDVKGHWGLRLATGARGFRRRTTGRRAESNIHRFACGDSLDCEGMQMRDAIATSDPLGVEWTARKGEGEVGGLAGSGHRSYGR